MATVETGSGPGHAAARRRCERAGYRPLPVARYFKALSAPETVGGGGEDGGMAEVRLREFEDGDLDALFEQMRDPEGVWMAAFTAEDPDDRAHFDAHMARVRATPGVTMRTIVRDGRMVGHVASFPSEGDLEVTYVVDRACWGHGVASRALALLLEEVTDRPLYARAASDNLGSLRVLGKAGFKVIGTERSFARARQAEIEESVLRLD